MDLRLEKKWLLLIYNLVIWIIFFAVYASMMTPDHFALATKRDATEQIDLGSGTAAYFAVVVHATVGFGDIYPISARARAAVALHITMVILGSLGIYLLPIERFMNADRLGSIDWGSLETGLHIK